MGSLEAKEPMVHSNSRQPALVFDFGGVLIEWDPRNLYRKIFNDDLAAVETFLRDSKFMEWNIHQDAGRPFSEAVDEFCSRMPQYCDLIRAYDQRYEESITGPNWQTVEILRTLKAASYPLYGLSNWPAEKWRLVRPKYEFFGWFDYILISGEVKLAKPDPRIFNLFLEQTGLPAEQCLYIDDSPHNTEVAGQLGFQTIHFRSAEQLHEELCHRGILDGVL
jgi:2-haloacid dehalogenase